MKLFRKLLISMAESFIQLIMVLKRLVKKSFQIPDIQMTGLYC